MKKALPVALVLLASAVLVNISLDHSTSRTVPLRESDVQIGGVRLDLLLQELQGLAGVQEEKTISIKGASVTLTPSEGEHPKIVGIASGVLALDGVKFEQGDEVDALLEELGPPVSSGGMLTGQAQRTYHVGDPPSGTLTIVFTEKFVSAIYRPGRIEGHENS